MITMFDMYFFFFFFCVFAGFSGLISLESDNESEGDAHLGRVETITSVFDVAGNEKLCSTSVLAETSTFGNEYNDDEVIGGNSRHGSFDDYNGIYTEDFWNMLLS